MKGLFDINQPNPKQSTCGMSLLCLSILERSWQFRPGLKSIASVFGNFPLVIRRIKSKYSFIIFSGDNITNNLSATFVPDGVLERSKNNRKTNHFVS